jgi:hypothetical protein
LVELAVADAPDFTEEQIIELRRVFKPYLAELKRSATDRATKPATGRG